VGKLLLIAAALGGLTLLRVSFPQEQKPMMVIYAHASIAIAALLTSIIGVFTDLRSVKSLTKAITQ